MWHPQHNIFLPPQTSDGLGLGVETHALWGGVDEGEVGCVRGGGDGVDEGEVGWGV